jgi:hypothetical protein
MKREIAKSRPESRPRPRARRAFFSDSISDSDSDEAFRISHKLGHGLAAKFSKAFAIQLDRFRGQYTPRPTAHPPKESLFGVFPCSLSRTCGDHMVTLVNSGVCLGKHYFRETNFRDLENWGVVKF